MENDSLINDFIVESRDNLVMCENGLLSLEGGHNPETINDVFRAIHSVKGAAGFLKLNHFESLAHRAESILSAIRSGNAEITQELISALLHTVDKLKEMIESSSLGEDLESDSILHVLEDSAKDAGIALGAVVSPKTRAATFSSKNIRIAHDKKRIGTFLYGIILNYSSVNDKRPKLLDLFEHTCAILHSSEDLDKLSEQTPLIELYIESILEPEILLPLIAVLGCPAKVIDSNFEVENEASLTEQQLPKQKIDNVHGTPAISPLIDKSGPLKKAPPEQGVSSKSQTIRIGVNVLDELLELIGEVVLGRNQFLNKYNNDKGFKSLSQSITKLHQHVIQTRMQSIHILFEKYKRTVRDLSQMLNKKIELSIEGSELELDRTVIEGLADPLTHLVRNSIDHGIETPEERSKLGKAVVGTISLRAIHESGQILIEIEDDGRGLDREVILKKAIEKHLVDPEEAPMLDNKSIYNLIFYPGFSTKDVATEISGRGVGMDVVKTNLEKLGCAVELASNKNKGTLVSISIPLTQAVVNSSVISGLIIAIGQYSLAIPQLAVNEIIKLTVEEQKDKIEMVNGREVFKLRDRLIPLIHLEDILGIKRTCYNPLTGTFVADRRERIQNTDVPIDSNRRQKGIIFIVLNFKHDYFGILVDKIERTEEIVVKRMPKIIKNRKVFAGATILGNGKVSLILDISGMVEKAGLNFNKKLESKMDMLRFKSQHDNTQRVVIFNNADNEYFAIPVNLLSEVDRFSDNEIRKVGDKEYIKRHGESVPLLRLENSLSVSPLSTGKESHIILIPSRLKYPTGIVGNSIVNTIDLTEDINTKDADDKGVMGTFFHETQLVNILDIYMLIQRSDPERYKSEVDVGIEKCRVLFVDDQLFFRQLVTQYFKSYGINNITVVSNGQEVLQTLYSQPDSFDVVVSDIEMPVMNGYQLVASIKSDKRFSHLPVMALTTLDSEQNIKKGYEAGFDAYEVKLDKESVIKQVEKLFFSSRKKRIKGEG